MRDNGFEGKKIRRIAVCPICGQDLLTFSPRRKYCYNAKCQSVRNHTKINRKKRMGDNILNTKKERRK